MSKISSILEWFFNASIPLSDTQNVALREVVGVTLGLTSAFLGARRKVLAWPIGIIADGLLVTVFLGAIFAFGDSSQHANFYGQAGRNLLLIAVSAYGWFKWARYRNRNAQHIAVSPRWMTSQERLIAIPITAFFFIVSYSVFRVLGESGHWLLVDTWIFTGTALATFGMSRGYIEFWLAWIAVDLVGVPFAFSNGYYPTATLYAVYLPFVSWGFLTWRRILRSESI